MSDALDGKWTWLWNWRRCDGGDPAKIAARLKSAGCTGVIVKAFDGPHWFEQGITFRDIAARLKSQGVRTVGWGYLYGRDPAGEAQRAVETAQYGQAHAIVLDVETEFKGRPEAAEELCRRIRDSLGPNYPLYFSTFAIARYHRAFPYEVFRRYCTGTVPQVYWNAFRWPVPQALAWMYEDYAALAIPASQVFPAGGLYKEGYVTFPPPHEVRDFAARAAAAGSRGISFWSYEHMDERMWQAVAAATIGRQEEVELSSQEYNELSREIAAVGARVDRLSADVQSLKGGAPAAPRRYTVRPGDTLSGIAAAHGLPDWHRLYEANRSVIGGDPNLIRPGQVLLVP
jgi:LysM repeat protein